MSRSGGREPDRVHRCQIRLESAPELLQIHLDLWVEDIDAAHEHVMGLGARLLQEKQGSDGPDAFQVYADPAGHPFCLCWITGAGQ